MTMKNAKSLSKLTAALDYDSARLRKIISTLITSVDGKFSHITLKGIALDGREHLAIHALRELGVFLSGKSSVFYSIDRSRIDTLALQLETLIDQHTLEANSAQQNITSQPFFDLAWTLPDQLEDIFELPHKSLAGLLKLTIANAKNTLFLVSPFLEKTGLQIIEGPIIGAFNRGVKISLISHDLDNTSSANYVGYSYLKSIIPNLVAYTSSLSQNNSPYFLIHAKIIVSDDKFAVLSSANLTQYGLGTHLELGVGLTGEPASQLRSLVNQIINSSLVIPMV
jgi:phosphatidylserine/phosphatidylglycerophosphate/cardiolipin synthase-like enzyme